MLFVFRHLVFHRNDYMGEPKVSEEKIKEDIADEFTGLFLVPAASFSQRLSGSKGLFYINLH